MQKTCRDCGHKTKEKRELTLTHDPATCPHSIVDHRGSSRSTHRTFCKQCGTFIDEVPGDFHKERRNAAEQVLNATAEALGTVQALTSEDATTCLDATLVEGIVGVFADRVSTMVAIEQAISPQTLHDVLRDCIIEITDDPESPQVNAGEPSPVAMMGLKQPNYGIRFAQCPRSITWYNLTASLLRRHRQEVFDDLRALLRPRTMVETPRVQPPYVTGPMRPGTPPPADEPNLDELSDGELLRMHDQWPECMGFYGEDPYDPYLECSPTKRNDLTAIRSPSQSSEELPDIDLFEGYTGPPPLITRAGGMCEARTPTVPRPYTVGLPLTRLAQEPTLRRGAAQSQPSNPDGPAGANPYASRRVAMTGTKNRGDEVFIGNLKMVDLWSPSEPHIWGALDEGCNSTCHSRAWGDLVEWKLKSFGLGFLWVDSEAKYFTGLGSTTGTLGRRKLPFCLSLDKGHDTLAGVMESHEVDAAARNPLLISLFAQSTLGLVKDMSTCICTIQGKVLERARCADTGLLLLNLSQYGHRQHKLPLCVREIKLPTTDHLVGARPVAAAMASDSAHPASTSGGGRDEEADAPDYDPGVTAPVEEEAEPAAPARPIVTISDRVMEHHTQPDVVPTRENAGVGHTARMTPRNTMNELLTEHNAGFLWPQDGRINPLRDTMFSQVPPICIMTAGVKYYQFPGNPHHTVSNPNVWKRLLPQELTTGKQIAIWDLRPLRDEADGAFNAHVGRHQAIINNLLWQQAGSLLPGPDLWPGEALLGTRTKSLPCSRVHEQSAPLRGVRDHAARSVLAPYHVGSSRRQARWELEPHEVWRQMSRLRSDRLHTGHGSGLAEPGQKALVSRLCRHLQGPTLLSLTTCGRGEPNLARPSGSWDLSRPTATCTNSSCQPPGGAGGPAACQCTHAHTYSRDAAPRNSEGNPQGASSTAGEPDYV